MGENWREREVERSIKWERIKEEMTYDETIPILAEVI